LAVSAEHSDGQRAAVSISEREPEIREAAAAAIRRALWRAKVLAANPEPDARKQTPEQDRVK
jgi:hypothetical protein